MLEESICAEAKNPAVSLSHIKEIHSSLKSGATFKEVISRLRLKCVPAGYTPTPWKHGLSLIVQIVFFTVFEVL